MSILQWMIFFIVLELAVTTLFALIYRYWDDRSVKYWDDAFFLSVQIQTSIGITPTDELGYIKNIITIQAIVSDILNILLITFVGIYVGTLVSQK